MKLLKNMPVARCLLWLVLGPILSWFLGAAIVLGGYSLSGGISSSDRGDVTIGPILIVAVVVGAIVGVAGIFGSLFMSLASLRGVIDDDANEPAPSNV